MIFESSHSKRLCFFFSPLLAAAMRMAGALRVEVAAAERGRRNATGEAKAQAWGAIVDVAGRCDGGTAGR